MAEFVGRLIVTIYCMSPMEIIACAVFAALAFSSFCRTFAGRRWLRPVLASALGVWCAAILYITIFSRESGCYESRWIPLITYWLVLQGETTELLRSAMMNVALFFPAGLLICAILPDRSLWNTALIYGVLSLFIELTQTFLQLGFGELDDILHNTLGAVCGFAAFHWASAQDRYQKVSTGQGTELPIP